MATLPLSVRVASSLEKIINPIPAEDVPLLTLEKHTQAGTARATKGRILFADSTLEFFKGVRLVGTDDANG